jgi:hypothetical protein
MAQVKKAAKSRGSGAPRTGAQAAAVEVADAPATQGADASAAQVADAAAAERDTNWTKPKEEAFFFELGQLCNVAKALERAGLGDAGWALHRKRKDPEFEARFDAAIAQGFAHLELEMLERARHGDDRPEPATEAERKLRETATSTGLHLLRIYQSRVKGAKAAVSAQRPMRGAKLRDALEARLAEISRRLGGQG